MWLELWYEKGVEVIMWITLLWTLENYVYDTVYTISHFVFHIFTCIPSQLDTNTLNTKYSMAFIHEHLLYTHYMQGTRDKNKVAPYAADTLSTGGSQMHKRILTARQQSWYNW